MKKKRKRKSGPVPMGLNSNFSVRLHNDDLEEVERLASERRLSKCAIIRGLVNSALKAEKRA